MGDRYFWNENCPRCGGIETVECYDMPSSLMWGRSCSACEWKDDRDYYETEKNTIKLLTKNEAEERGLIN